MNKLNDGIEHAKIGERLRRRVVPLAKGQIDKTIATIKASTDPPWHPLRSRAVADLLDVSLQTSANWRVRDCGPDPEPFRRGHGNRTFYRPDKIVDWLTQGSEPYWLVSNDWLKRYGIGLEAPTQEAVDQHTKWFDDHNFIWPQ